MNLNELHKLLEDYTDISSTDVGYNKLFSNVKLEKRSPIEIEPNYRRIERLEKEEAEKKARQEKRKLELEAEKKRKEEEQQRLLKKREAEEKARQEKRKLELEAEKKRREEEEQRLKEKYERERLNRYETELVEEIKPNATILIAGILCDLEKIKDKSYRRMRNCVHTNDLKQVSINIDENTDNTNAYSFEDAQTFARRFSLLTKSDFVSLSQDYTNNGIRLVCNELNKGLKARIIKQLKALIDKYARSPKTLKYRKFLFKTEIQYIDKPVTNLIYNAVILLDSLQNSDSDSAYNKIKYPSDLVTTKDVINDFLPKFNTYFRWKTFGVLSHDMNSYTYLRNNKLIGDGIFLYLKED